MQFMLSPIYLLGASASGSRPSLAWLPAFLAVHVALYGGATAFNSYYDRDVGPISFRKHPLPPSRGDLWGAVALQVAGLLVLFALRGPAGLVAAIMFLMGIAYSHPKWRWKRSLGGSLATVALGQGAGGFYLGFLAAGGVAGQGEAMGAGPLHGAALGTALVTAGVYPITQVYQVEEDLRRTDTTLATRFGWRTALYASSAGIAVGCWALVLALWGRTGVGWRVGLAMAPLIVACFIMIWTRRFQEQDSYLNHDWAMMLCGSGSLFFLALALLGMRA